MLCFKPRVPWAGQALKLKGGAHFKLAVQPAPYFSDQHIVDLAHSLASTEGVKGAYQFKTLPTAEASQLSSTRLESHGPAGKAAARMLFDEMGVVQGWAKLRFSGVDAEGSVTIKGGAIPGYNAGSSPHKDACDDEVRWAVQGVHGAWPSVRAWPSAAAPVQSAFAVLLTSNT